MAILFDPISDFSCIFDNIDTYQLTFFWSIKQEAIWLPSVLLFYMIPFWLCLCVLLCPLPSQLTKEGRASPRHQVFDPTGYTIIPAWSQTLLTNEEAGPCDQESLSGLPWWCSGWESACQCRRHGFKPWSGKIPHAAEQLGPWTTTTEPARLEPVLRNKRGRDSERPTHRDEEWPPLATTRESPRTEMKTQHSQK